MNYSKHGANDRGAARSDACKPLQCRLCADDGDSRFESARLEFQGCRSRPAANLAAAYSTRNCRQSAAANETSSRLRTRPALCGVLAEKNRMDYDEEDKLDTERFNRELWKGMLGNKPYPAVGSGINLRENRRALLASHGIE